MLDDLIGKPFKHGGRGPESFDCYGLAMEIYARRGIALPDFNAIDDASVIHEAMLKGRELFQRHEEPLPWSIVTFWLKAPYTSHVGIVLPDKLRFIHILKSCKVVTERLDSVIWKRKITGYYTWKN